MGVISAMAEEELGERNFGFDSLKSRLKRDMEEEELVAAVVFSRQLSGHFGSISSQMLHCFDLMVVHGLLRRQVSASTQRSEQWSVGEKIWTRTDRCLLKTSFSIAA